MLKGVGVVSSQGVSAAGAWGRGRFPAQGKGFSPRMGIFGEQRVLQPMDGKRNEVAETLQGCSTEKTNYFSV